jgi:hypothetical protein
MSVRPLQPKIMMAAAALAIFASALAASPALAQTQFDGNWSVTITTETGTCIRSRRVVVQVADGLVTYAGAEQVTAEGRVGDNGIVDVRFVYETDRLEAGGSVSGGMGSGSWSSPNNNCSGSWMARRAG